MKKIIIFLLFLFALIAVTPFVTGYLFKQSFYAHLAKANETLIKLNTSTEMAIIEVTNYQQGWLSSNIQMVMKFTDTNKVITIPMQSTIQHGPLVKFLNEWKVGLAKINTAILAPVEIPATIKLPANIFNSESLVSLDSKTMTDKFYIENYTDPQGIISWNGISGESVTLFRNDAPVSIELKLSINHFEAQDKYTAKGNMILDGLNVSYTTTYNGNFDIWEGGYTGVIKSIFVKYDQDSYQLANLKFNAVKKTNELGYYSDKSELYLGNLTVPTSYQMNQLSDIRFSDEVHDINLHKFVANKANANPSDLITPTSSAKFNLIFQSNLGPGSLAFSVDSIKLMSSSSPIPEDFNAIFTLTFTRAMLEAAIKSQLTGEENIPPAEVTDKINEIITALLQKNYITQNKDGYAVSVIHANKTLTLNGQVITEVYPKLLEVVGMLTIRKPEPVVANVPPPTSDSQCYWMENQTGKNEWVSFPGVSKQQCFSMDSCNGGQKASGGGCYKWAASPTAPAEPW